MTPRLLNHAAAAEYCGMSEPHFDSHIAPHVPPMEFGKKRLWDRCAIDNFLDTRSHKLQGFLSSEEWLERA